tara:strand:- start:533 stop:718 length:186 start_codon:yes stop_codon:yes gene_type:complete
VFKKLKLSSIILFITLIAFTAVGTILVSTAGMTEGFVVIEDNEITINAREDIQEYELGVRP